MKPTISKPFKSNDRTFDKVYNAFDKRDYFNSQGLAKVQIGNFERALQKNDKGAQQVLDLFKGDEKKAKDYITQVVSDRNKERAFNNYKALKSAVDSIQKGKPNVGAVDYVKRIIHNSSQKYSIALYSTLRNKKFTKWKDVHNDIDSLIGESVNEAYIVLHSPKKGVKPVTTAAYKDKKDAEKWAKDLGGITMIVKKKVKGIDEGKKRFKRQDGIGKAKYTISYHDGKKKHKDGSDFFDIKIFKNKKDLSDFVGTLAKQGYKLTRESVNEEVPQGYNPVVEDKSEITKLVKKVNKSETKFYDVLSVMEKKYGKRQYRIWLEKSLKDFGVNPKHYDYRTNAAAEEKLFQLGK
jgi:predicted nucleic-acid-binding protein